eukprot:gene4114-5147_t
MESFDYKIINNTEAKTVRELEDQYDVIIVGCGPNGGIMGNLLGQYNIKTLILESSNEIFNIPRAAHIDDEGLRILQKVGLEQEILENSYELDVYFNREFFKNPLVRIESTKTQYGYPRSIFWNQPDFEATVRRGLDRFDHVSLALGMKVLNIEKCGGGGEDVHPSKIYGNRINVLNKNTQQTKTVKCKFIIGADGGNSQVRKHIKSNFPGHSGSMKWLVIDVVLGQDHPQFPQVFQFVCNPKRPSISLPIPNGHYRWEFALFPGEDEKQMESLENVHTMLKTCGADLSKLTIVRKSIYSFQNRIADKWFDGDSIFLIGDAAHCVPPFLGMGISSGFRDAFNLSWKIDLVLRGVCTDTSIFDSYKEERHPNIKKISENSLKAGGIIMTSNPVLSTIRNFVLSTVLSIPYFRNILTTKEMKPPNDIPFGVGLLDHKSSRSSIVGKMMVQPNVKLLSIPSILNEHYELVESNNPKTFPIGGDIKLDQVLGNGFSVILNNLDLTFSNHQEQFSQLISNPILSNLKTNFVTLLNQYHNDNNNKNTVSKSEIGNLYKNVFEIQDNPESTLTTFIQTNVNSGSSNNSSNQFTMVLIRPDRHVFGVYQSDKINVALNSLQESLLIE